MAPKQERIIGPATEEMDPNLRAERDRGWEARNMDSRNPSSLASSRWNTKPDWRPVESRREIFAKMQRLEGRGRLTPQMQIARVNQARRKVYEDMHKRKCETGDVGASAVNVDYYIDALLWTDHVQERAKEEFPWEWPALYQADKGYADFVASLAGRSQWTADVLAGDETTRVQRQQEHDETEARLKAEGKDWAALSAPITEKRTPIEVKDGERVVGEPQLVIRTKPSAAEPAKEEVASEAAKKEASANADVKAEDVPWSMEQMTELYREIFGAAAYELSGMGGFQLPMEVSLARIAVRGCVLEARTLFPASIEIRPVDLGWGRNKLCLRFASWVKRDQADFPILKFYLVCSWWILVAWKKTLLEVPEAKDDTMYNSIRGVMDGWTQQTAQDVNLYVIHKAWEDEFQADLVGLEDDASKQRLRGAVFKVVASSRGQDDYARACGVLDWASADPEKLGAGPRMRTYLAVVAMHDYCKSEPGEEKLGRIAQHMMELKKEASPALLKKKAAEAAMGVKPAPK